MKSAADASCRLPNHGMGLASSPGLPITRQIKSRGSWVRSRVKSMGRHWQIPSRGVDYELDMVGEHDCKNFTSVWSSVSARYCTFPVFESLGFPALDRIQRSP